MEERWYAKLDGHHPLHVFDTRWDRAAWLDAQEADAEAVRDGWEALLAAEREGHVVCHFPAKPDPMWDGEYVWYPADAVGYVYEPGQEIEWFRHRRWP